MSLTILFCAKRLFRCNQPVNSDEFKMYLEDLQLVLGTSEIDNLFFQHISWQTMPPMRRRACLINYIETELKAASLID